MCPNEETLKCKYSEKPLAVNNFLNGRPNSIYNLRDRRGHDLYAAYKIIMYFKPVVNPQSHF